MGEGGPKVRVGVTWPPALRFGHFPPRGEDALVVATSAPNECRLAPCEAPGRDPAAPWQPARAGTDFARGDGLRRIECAGGLFRTRLIPRWRSDSRAAQDQPEPSGV